MESYLKYKDAKKKFCCHPSSLGLRLGWGLGRVCQKGVLKELPDPSLEIYYLTHI